MLHMKALSGRLRGKGLAALVLIIVIVVIGLIVYLVHHHHASSSKQKTTAVAFDVSTISLIGPNCSYPTPLGCFIPTDSQAHALSKLNTQGYAMAHVEGQGYTNYQLVPGTVPKAPLKRTKALHVTSVTSIKSTGQKQQ